MNLKTLTIGAGIIFSGTLLFSCNDTTTQPEETVQTPADTQQPVTDTSSQCYAMNNGKDSAWMEITRNDTLVTGKLNFNHYEKDKNSGSIEGVIKGDTLFATYTFRSEGMTSKRQVAFLKKEDGWVEGYAKADPETGEPDFSNKPGITFQNTFVLKKTGCR